MVSVISEAECFPHGGGRVSIGLSETCGSADRGGRGGDGFDKIHSPSRIIFIVSIS